MPPRVRYHYLDMRTLVLVWLTVALVAGLAFGQKDIDDLRKRAEQGDADAQHSLGVMYHNGEGVPQDYAEAVKWYRLAAEQGFAVAQLNLVFMYYNGEGVPQDYVQAHKWSNLAASKATGDNREKATSLRDAVAAQMTREQIAEAQRLAREWTPKTWEELKL